jgi:hypothetical protein
MLSLHLLTYILSEYVSTLNNVLVELDYYETPCHKEIGKSRVPKVQRSKSK